MKKLLPLISFVAAEAGAVTLTELDDFNSTTEGWFEGGRSTSQPIQIPVGGPDGSGFLQDVSNGFPPGKNMQFWNVTQWNGDYLGIGLNRITLDAINFNGVAGDSIHLS